MTEQRLAEIEAELGMAITDERDAPLTMRHTVRCAAAAKDLVAQVRKLRGALEEARQEIARNFDCNHPAQYDDADQCDGEDCIRCWMENHVASAIPAAGAAGQKP